jgi:hypothetical protein
MATVAIPFHCQFCGEMIWLPSEKPDRGECRTCGSTFTLSYMGLLDHIARSLQQGVPE